MIVDLGAPVTLTAILLRSSFNHNFRNTGVKDFAVDAALTYTNRNWEHLMSGVLGSVLEAADCASPPVETFPVPQRIIRYLRLRVLTFYGDAAGLFYMGFEHSPAEFEGDFIITEPKIVNVLSHTNSRDFHHQFLHSVKS